MKIAPFRIEQYYAVHEFTAPYMLSSSDAESVTTAELLELEPDAEERLLAQHLGYTESVGAPELRDAIAPIYETLSPADVVVVAAAEEGIFVAYHALLEPGDHVVVETPCYESALQVALSAGATVSEWRRSASNGWAHDLDALRTRPAAGHEARLHQQPAQPDGDADVARGARRRRRALRRAGAWLFSDEVYRELEHDPADRLPAACDLYERALSLGSMSKTYGLPGLRLGWLACRDRDALQRIVDLKHYTTICSSAPSELLSALALRHRDVLADRNRGIVLANLPLLDAFFERHADVLSWVRPTAGPIGFPRLHGVGRRDRVLRAAGRRRGRAAASRRRLRRAGARPCRLRPRRHARGPGTPRALHRHTFLTLLKQRRNPDARFPNNLPIHLGADNTTPSRRGAAMGDGQRLTTWIEWYRFAREALELGHAEASSYATARYVEEQNRTQTREWRAA